MNRQRLFGLAAAVLTVAAVSLVFAAPANAADGVHQLDNFNDLLCLQPAGDSVDAGAPVVQEFCSADPSQAWVFHSLGGNSYRIQNQNSQLCLDAFGGATNGTSIVQWPCANISNQKWDTTRALPDVVPLVSQVSGTHTHCLDVPGAQSTLGLAVQLFGCNGTGAQAWAVGIGISRQS